MVDEHYQKHTIVEVDHVPEHEDRVETKEFRSAKYQLEKLEHLPCYICGTMEKRQSHHIFERCYWNGYDLEKVCFMLYNHYDYHGHCKRDFNSSSELLKFFIDHYNGKLVKTVDEDGIEFEYWTCDNEACDTIYFQWILCESHHVGQGTGAHKSTAATHTAWTGHRKGFKISMSLKEYEELAHKKV